MSPSWKESKNLPLEFIENELIILKGRLEGEGEIDDDSERGRFIARANQVGGAIVSVEVPPSVG